MNPRKVALVALKTIRETLREPVLITTGLLLPVFMLLIMWVGYSSSPRPLTYTLLLDDHSGGLADGLIAHIRAAVYADGRPTFKVLAAESAANADEMLRAGQAALLLSLGRDAQDPQKLTANMRGDATAMNFSRASYALDETIGAEIDSIAGRPAAPGLGLVQGGIPGPTNDFDAFTPGILVFAALMLIPQTALLLGRERRAGTLRRLQITRLKPAELLGGIALAQFFTALVEIAIVLPCAMLLGFHARGSLAPVVLIMLALSLSAIGLGLVVAGFCKNDSDALNLGATVSMVMVFLSGAFFAMPPMTLSFGGQLLRIAGHEIDLFDFLPATHAMLALQQVLIGGAGLAQVSFRLGAAALLSAVVFAVGIGIFQITQWNPNRRA